MSLWKVTFEKHGEAYFTWIGSTADAAQASLRSRMALDAILKARSPGGAVQGEPERLRELTARTWILSRALRTDQVEANGGVAHYEEANAAALACMLADRELWSAIMPGETYELDIAQKMRDDESVALEARAITQTFPRRPEASGVPVSQIALERLMALSCASFRSLRSKIEMPQSATLAAARKRALEEALETSESVARDAMETIGAPY